MSNDPSCPSPGRLLGLVATGLPCLPLTPGSLLPNLSWLLLFWLRLCCFSVLLVAHADCLQCLKGVSFPKHLHCLIWCMVVDRAARTLQAGQAGLCDTIEREG